MQATHCSPPHAPSEKGMENPQLFELHIEFNASMGATGNPKQRSPKNQKGNKKMVSGL